MPFTDKVDFTLSFGPSLFNVKQVLLTGVSYTDVPPSFDPVTIDSVNSVELRDSGWGFNLGGEVTYALTPISAPTVCSDIAMEASSSTPRARPPMWPLAVSDGVGVRFNL